VDRSPETPDPQIKLLVERDCELATIDDRLDALVAGSGVLLAVEAGAGLGKTVLLDGVRGGARRRGARVLATRGVALERQVPFGLVRELLDTVRTDAAGGRGAGARTPSVYAAALERLEREPPLPGDRSYVSLLRDLYEMVCALADEAPLVLVLDDAHHADADSLRWLDYVQRRLTSVPVLVALAARPSEPGVDPMLLAPLLDGFASTLLRPAPLSPSGVQQVVLSRFPTPAAEFSHACHFATGGNPFLLSALLAECRDGSAHEAVGVPGRSCAGIARSIAVRLDLGPPKTAAVARAAAVLDGGAELRQVAQLAGVEPAEAWRAADALTAMQILKPQRPLVFEHPIVWAAIYGDLSRGERALAHARAARLIDEEGGTPERVAAHLLQTEPAADGWVLKTLHAAARTAAIRGTSDVAILLLRRALREPPMPSQRFELLLDLARAEARVDGEAALRTLATARTAADGDEQAVDAVVLEARVLTLRGSAGEAIELLAGALARLAPHGHVPRTRLESEMAGMRLLVGTTPPGSALDPEPGARESDGARHGHRALHSSFRGLPAHETVALARASLASSTLPVGDWDAAPSLAALLAIDVLCLSGEIGVATQELERARQLAGEQGSSLGLVGIDAVDARLELARGDLPRAERLARAGLGPATTHGWRLVVPLLTAVLIDVLVERGELGEAAKVAAATQPREPGGSLYSNLLLASVGRFETARGAVAEGLRCALLAGERASAGGMLNPALLPWRSDAARAHLLLGEPDRALALAEDELARAEAFGAPRARGVALLTAGLAGGEAAESRLRAAVVALESAGACVDLARAHVELGALLRRRGCRADAHHPLRQALDLAHRCGATAIETRARDELAATGIRPRRPLMTGPEALTPRERVVAQKAADGRANRAIAAELFVTVKTVEAHLRSVYHKLGISSRRELPADLEGGHVPSDGGR
jgi:DNA-binding CsgD family transcriptional regulator